MHYWGFEWYKIFVVCNAPSQVPIKHEAGMVSPELAAALEVPDDPYIHQAPEDSELIVPTETIEDPAPGDEVETPPIENIDGTSRDDKGTEDRTPVHPVDGVEEKLPEIKVEDDTPKPDEPLATEPPVVSRKSQFEMKNAQGDGSGRGRGRGKGKGRGGRKGRGRGGGRGKNKPVVIEDSEDEKPDPKPKRKPKRPSAKSKANKSGEKSGQEQDEKNEQEAQEVKIVWGPLTKTGKDGFERLLAQATPPGPGSSRVAEPTEVPEPAEVPEPTVPKRKRAKVGESIHGPSFARRPCPKTSPAKHRWSVIKSAYSFLGSLVVEMGYHWGSHEVGKFWEGCCEVPVFFFSKVFQTRFSKCCLPAHGAGWVVELLHGEVCERWSHRFSWAEHWSNQWPSVHWSVQCYSV